MTALLLLIPIAALGYAVGWFVRRTGRRVITIDVDATVGDRVVKYAAKYHHLDLIVYGTGQTWRIRIVDSQLPEKGGVEERTYPSSKEAQRDAIAAAHSYLQEFYKDQSHFDFPEGEIHWETVEF